MNQRQWRKSSRSGGGGGTGGGCVEVAPEPLSVWVRDSKNPYSGEIRLAPTIWAAFLDKTRTESQ